MGYVRHEKADEIKRTVFVRILISPLYVEWFVMYVKIQLLKVGKIKILHAISLNSSSKSYTRTHQSVGCAIKKYSLLLFSVQKQN